MPVPWALLHISFQIPSKGAPLSGSPNKAPAERDAPFPEPSYYLSKFPVNGTPTPPQVPQRGPYGERYLFPEPSLKVPFKGAPLTVPQQGPYGEKCPVSRASGLFIHLHLSKFPGKEPSHKIGEHIESLSMEPHMDGRSTYKAVWPGSLRESFMMLLSLHKCHAGFSTIPCTLAWVEQSPVSQHVLWQPSTGYPLYTCSHLPRDPGCSRIHITLRYGRKVGFMGGLLCVIGIEVLADLSHLNGVLCN